MLLLLGIPLVRRELLLLSTSTLVPSRASAASVKQETSSTRVSWGPFKGLSNEQMDELDARSRDPTAGVELSGGARIIDLVEGDGPLPQRGDRVWVHYKVWADGFRVGKAGDYSFADGRPYDWILGEPTSRMPAPIDAGVAGMREGGWRRIVVPDAFGDAGLRKVSRGPQGRYVGGKAPYVVQPHARAFVDLIMLDGGSGRCASLLRPPGVSELEARKLRSLTCSARNEIF